MVRFNQADTDISGYACVVYHDTRFTVMGSVIQLIIAVALVSAIEADEMVDFCYKNIFTSSDEFGVLDKTPVDAVTLDFVIEKMNFGLPFVVSHLTHDWRANVKWDHEYFEALFGDSELFSSTFSTLTAPKFSSNQSTEEVYFGMFLNDERLSKVLQPDYQYPTFIPEEWRNVGNEWIHWGYPPCGARRHMDLMCTSRISVQVKGKKIWRLYPILVESELDAQHSNWSMVLKPQEVTLSSGDALVWFPGWEHETVITEGLSVSISLHFDSPRGSVYQNTFHQQLSERVSHHCDWLQH